MSTKPRLRLQGMCSMNPLGWVHRPTNKTGIFSTSSTRSGLSSQPDSRSQSQLSMVDLQTMSTSPSLSWCSRLANKRNVCFGSATRRSRVDLIKAGRATIFHPPQDSSASAPRSETPNLGTLRASVMNARPALVAMDVSPAVRRATENSRRAVSIGGQTWIFGSAEANCNSCGALKQT